jgi:hypothetical protein
VAQDAQVSNSAHAYRHADYCRSRRGWPGLRSGQSSRVVVRRRDQGSRYGRCLCDYATICIDRGASGGARGNPTAKPRLNQFTLPKTSRRHRKIAAFDRKVYLCYSGAVAEFSLGGLPENIHRGNRHERETCKGPRAYGDSSTLVFGQRPAKFHPGPSDRAVEFESRIEGW